MKYLPQKLSSKLHKMGVVCSSGMWHVQTNHSITMGKRTIPERWQITGEGFAERYKPEHKAPAYDLASILSKEALIKMFGKEMVDEESGLTKKELEILYKQRIEEQKNSTKLLPAILHGEYFDKPAYQYQAYQILDQYLAGGMEAVEKYLEGVLK